MRIAAADAVAIKWCSPTTLTASVRDSDGIVDVRCTADGWTCTCSQPFSCAHILAVKNITAVGL